MARDQRLGHGRRRDMTDGHATLPHRYLILANPQRVGRVL